MPSQQWTPSEWRGVAEVSYRVAARVLRDPDLARDVSQDVVALILAVEERSPGTIDDVEAYASTVAFRAAVRVSEGLRKADRPSREDELNDVVEPTDDLQKLVLRLYVEDVLSELSPQQARAIQLRFLMDLPVVDVAAQLGVSINTAKTHLKLGRKRLREVLSEEVG